MSRYGNGSCASLQAPVILMATLGYAASASTFGNSAQGGAGAGGLERLLQSQVIDDEPRVRIAGRQLSRLFPNRHQQSRFTVNASLPPQEPG